MRLPRSKEPGGSRFTRRAPHGVELARYRLAIVYACDVLASVNFTTDEVWTKGPVYQDLVTYCVIRQRSFKAGPFCFTHVRALQVDPL